MVKVTFKKHELQSYFAFFETHLNVTAKMEITSEAKMHICHLKLNILGWQIIYYQ